MSGRSQLTRGALPAALLALILLPGCLVTSGSKVEESGIAVSESTLHQIQLGQTTENWLIATLGAPSFTSDAASGGGAKVLRYDHTVERSSGGTVFLIFGGRSETIKRTRTFFEIQNGVITRYWTEA